MAFLTNLKIRTRLGLAFGLVLALLVAAIAIGLSQIASINAALVTIVDGNNVKMDATNDLRDAQRRVAISTRNIILKSDAAEMAEQKKLVDKAREDYQAASKILNDLVKLEVGKAILAKVNAASVETFPMMEEAMRLGLENKAQEATDQLIKTVAPAASRWQAALNEMVVHQQANNATAKQEAANDYATASLMLIVLGALAVVLGLVSAWLTTRSITGPIATAVQAAQAVAAGDMTTRIDITSTDETGQLLQALSSMQASLSNVVSSVRQGSEGLATASVEIAQGNNDLSARTEQQASALEETAASMEELSATVKQNADSARQANQLAMSASSVAVQGGVVVHQVVETMKGINDASRKIADIISVIDGIAFQTNILALNAAVEAARAGEQGRGFAVVASEVRSLAGRSAEAAKEIKSLINASVERVDHGTALVDQAGSTMTEVVSSIKRVTDLMGEISAASNEQAAGVSQVGEAVTQMDQVTQQNAALVEEMAAAASSLKGQAQDLVQLVAVFNLGSDGSAPKRASQSQRAPTAFQRSVAPKTPAPRLAAKAAPKSAALRPALARPATAVPKATATAKAAHAGADDDWETF